MPSSKKTSSIKQTNIHLDQATSTQRDVMNDILRVDLVSEIKEFSQHIQDKIERLDERMRFVNYKFEDGIGYQGNIKIALKYNPETKISAIKKLERISKPGLRKYCDSTNIPRVLNGLGIAIISTSKGVITDKEAKVLGVGGEVLCHVY